MCSESSPFQVHKSLYRAFDECLTYFRELVEIKKKQMYLGESDKGTMDLMGTCSYLTVIFKRSHHFSFSDF